MLLTSNKFYSPDGDGGGSSTPEPTFTQAQLDTIIKDRLAKASHKAETIKAQLLNEYGLDEAGVTEFKKFKQDKVSAEQKRLAEEGKFTEILTQTQQKHAKEIEDRTKAQDAITNKYHTTVLKNTVLSIAPELGIVSPEDVFQLTRSNFKIKADETIEVVGDNGEPLFDDKGKAYTVKSFLAKYLETKPHFVASTGSGTGAGGSGKANKGQKFSRSQLQDAKFYEANRDAILEAMANGKISQD